MLFGTKASDRHLDAAEEWHFEVRRIILAFCDTYLATRNIRLRKALDSQ